MADPAAPFLASVLTGPNAGAVIALSQGRHAFGGGDTDAVMLDGLPPSAMVLDLRDNMVRLESAQSAITQFNGQPMTVSRKGETALPVVLRLNDETLINLSRSTPLPPPRRSPWLLLLVGAAAFGFGMIGSATIRVEVPMVDAMPAVTMPPAGTAVIAARKPAGCDAECIAAAAAGLRAEMDAAGLDAMQIIADGGVLRVSGHPGAEHLATWQKLRSDFEGRWGQSLPLLVTLSEGPVVAPDLGVLSVWLGAQPELRARSGEVLREGDLTRDGWTVEAIAPGLVTLSRGERVTQIRF